jgi:hypothetical protein
MDRRNLVRQEEGSALVDIALILSLAVMIGLYMTDYALWARRAIQLQNAAAAGAAYGTIPGNMTNTSAMTAVANYVATGSTSGTAGVTVSSTSFYTCTAGGAHVTFSTTACSGTPPLQYVTTTASSTSSRLFAFPGIPTSLGMQASVTYRVEGTP